MTQPSPQASSVGCPRNASYGCRIAGLALRQHVERRGRAASLSSIPHGQAGRDCSGNPELSTCTIAPVSVSLGAQPATATAIISTRASGAAPPLAPPPLGTLRVVLDMLFGMLALAMLAGMVRAAQQRTWRGALVRLAALVVWATLA